MKNTLHQTIREQLRARIRSGADIAIAGPGLVGVADTELLGREDIAALAHNPDALLDDGHLLKDGGACKVARIRLGGRAYAMKRYNWRGWIKGLRYMIKGSRARHVWLHGHLFSAAGVPTPRPACWMELRRGGIIRHSYILTEYVQGRTLHEYLSDRHQPARQRLRAVQQMNEVFTRLHAHRITHGDLKRSNVLVVDGQIVLIDLDAAVAHRPGPLYAVKKRRDRRRFAAGMPPDGFPEGL